MMHFRHAAATDVGRLREHNEDSLLADEDVGLFVVADGMGGRAAGEIASRITVETIRETLAAQREVVIRFELGELQPKQVLAALGQAVHAASRAVLAAASQDADRRGMGTTTVAVLIAGDRAFVAHVGDSRMYLVRGGVCSQITRDHSLLDELVLTGHLTRSEANSAEMQRLRNVLARAVGVQPDILVDTLDFEVLPGDRFVLCSDGLSHYFHDGEIAELCHGDAEESVGRFIAGANDRGGHDNITAVVVAFGGDYAIDERAAAFRERLAALGALPLFADVDQRIRFHLALAAETVTVPAGTIVVREDHPVTALHIVADGRIRLAQQGMPADEAGPGAWFGDGALVDQWNRAATAIAVVPTRLVRISREAFLAVGMREPELHEQVLAGFSRAVTSKLRPAAAAPPGAASCPPGATS